jgi:hypothetical protein
MCSAIEQADRLADLAVGIQRELEVARPAPLLGNRDGDEAKALMIVPGLQIPLPGRWGVAERSGRGLRALVNQPNASMLPHRRLGQGSLGLTPARWRVR